MTYYFKLTSDKDPFKELTSVFDLKLKEVSSEIVSKIEDLSMPIFDILNNTLTPTNPVKGDAFKSWLEKYFETKHLQCFSYFCFRQSFISYKRRNDKLRNFLLHAAMLELLLLATTISISNFMKDIESEILKSIFYHKAQIQWSTACISLFIIFIVIKKLISIEKIRSEILQYGDDSNGI